VARKLHRRLSTSGKNKGGRFPASLRRKPFSFYAGFESVYTSSVPFRSFSQALPTNATLESQSR
jgi:hypothetical protein